MNKFHKQRARCSIKLNYPCQSVCVIVHGFENIQHMIQIRGCKRKAHVLLLLEDYSNLINLCDRKLLPISSVPMCASVFPL